jgi:hypothetical protein
MRRKPVFFVFSPKGVSMFLFNSLHQGSATSRNRKVSSLLRRHWARGVFALAVMFCLSALLFTGCKEPDNSGNLNGVWRDSYGDIITINASTIKYQYSGPMDYYEGTIVNSPDFTAASGVLIIQFTEYYDFVYESSPPYSLTSHTKNTANYGKYGALYWKDLTPNSVSMSDAYESGSHKIFDSLPLAQANFTMDRAGNYVDWSITSPYTK